MRSRPAGARRRGLPGSIFVAVATLITWLCLFAVAASHADAQGGCDPRRQTCGVGIGDPGAPGRPGDPGDPGGGGGGGGNGPVTPGCHNTDPEHGCNPCPQNGTIPKDQAACDAWLMNLFCTELNPAGLTYQQWQSELRVYGCLGSPYNPGSPAVAARKALAMIHFPKPSGDRSPSQHRLYDGYPFTWVNLWTYYWTDPTTWKSYSATATDGTQSATVTATPSELMFDPGDGSATVSCGGPGRPWRASDGSGAPSSGACGYQYRVVTSSPITSTQTLVWKLTWQLSGPVGGLPDTFSTSTSGQLQVMQIQTVVTR
jgi:hypothetical protein